MITQKAASSRPTGASDILLTLEQLPNENTLAYVRGAYATETDLSILSVEKISIGGQKASILTSAPDKSEPQMQQRILVLGDAKNSVFAYVAYPVSDEKAPADARRMFLSIEWPAQ